MVDISDFAIFGIIGVTAYALYRQGYLNDLFTPRVVQQQQTRTVKGKLAPVIKGTAPVSTGSTGTCGKHIYPIVGAAVNGGAGRNQNIHYSSSGKSAISHRVDIANLPGTAYEATVYLTFPTSCAGGGNTELTIKFYGPSHKDGACCWCLTSIEPNGKCGFGGEGPHPSTTTFQTVTGQAGNLVGKKVGVKAVIWKSGASIHQEIWVDSGGGWVNRGKRNVTSCGKEKTTTGPSPGSTLEIRCDCSNVVYHCSEVVAIRPGGPAPVASKVSNIL
jgi:hypothetical protein